MASHGGKSAGWVCRNVWAERAAAELFEKHGRSGLEKARLELATAKRARRRKLLGFWKQLEASPWWVASTAVIDPPRQLLVSRVSERRVDRRAVLDGPRSPCIIFDQSAVITQARTARGRNQKL